MFILSGTANGPEHPAERGLSRVSPQPDLTTLPYCQLWKAARLPCRGPARQRSPPPPAKVTQRPRQERPLQAKAARLPPT